MPRTIGFVVSRETFFTSVTFKRIVQGNPPFAVARSAQTCTRQTFPPAAPRGAAAAYLHPPSHPCCHAPSTEHFARVDDDLCNRGEDRRRRHPRRRTVEHQPAVDVQAAGLPPTRRPHPPPAVAGAGRQVVAPD